MFPAPPSSYLGEENKEQIVYVPRDPCPIPDLYVQEDLKVEESQDEHFGQDHSIPVMLF